MQNSNLDSLIKTDCGRAKYIELSKRNGLFAKIRLAWFVFFAVLKDWNLNSSAQGEESD